jgi:hypothetical protein
MRFGAVLIKVRSFRIRKSHTRDHINHLDQSCYHQLLQQCDIYSLFSLFAEGDILDCIIEFPGYALLHV